MYEILAVVVIMVLALLIFWGGLHFSQYKKRENAGCCGGGHCEAGGDQSSCYSSKENFVDNIDKIKTEKLELRNQQ